MNTKQIKTIAHQPPFFSATQRLERSLARAIVKLSKRVRLKNYSLLACVPSDDIGQCIMLHGLYEEKLLLNLFKLFHNFLPQFKEQIAIDGGANIGNHTLFFSRYFKQVIAFEPNPTALKLLDTNIFLNKTKNVHVIPVGLSDQSTILPFDENSENLGGSGFNLKIKPSIKLPTQHLKVEKGDTLLEQQKLNIENIPIALIKLDIEGHELSALQGLEKTIRKHQPIILFEAHASKGEHGSEAIFRYLKLHNYTNFYTIEEKKAHPFFLIRFFEKLKGREIVLNQISTPQNRYHSLIIAMTTNPFGIGIGT